MLILGWDEFASKVEGLINQGLRFLEDGLGVTAIEMLVQLCATLVLFIAVRFLLWNKVTAVLDARKKIVRDALNEKDDAIKEAKSLHESSEKELSEARIEAKNIISKAKSKGSVEAQIIVDDALEKAKLKIQNAEAEIEMKKADAEKEIKQQIIDVAYEMAGAIVEKEVAKGSYAMNVDDFIAKVNTDE